MLSKDMGSESGSGSITTLEAGAAEMGSKGAYTKAD